MSVIVITGCSSGFGFEAAKRFASRGDQVFATMRGLPRGEAMAMQAIAEQENLRISVIEIDVLSDASVAEGVAEAERLAGGALDVLDSVLVAAPAAFACWVGGFAGPLVA